MKFLKIFILVPLLSTLTCTSQSPQKFTKQALEDSFMTLNGESVTLQQILDAHKGKTIFIDLWASWCKDCLESFPKIKELQQENDKIAYVFLSLDRSLDKWKKGIEKYQLVGSHYYMQSGWDGPLGEFLDLDWIPRYLVVDANQTITIFKEIEVNNNVINSLQ